MKMGRESLGGRGLPGQMEYWKLKKAFGVQPEDLSDAKGQ